MALSTPTGMQFSYPFSESAGFPLATAPGYVVPKAQLPINLSTGVTSAWPLPGLTFTAPIPMPGAGGGGGAQTVGYAV